MKISICIPTFNRAEVVYKNVIKCLEHREIDLEVVVSDNCSEDNTEKILGQIEDNRFKYVKNEYNNGFENLVSVLTYAEGDYLLLTSDEDQVIFSSLKEVIPVLENENPAILKGGASLFGKSYIVHRDGNYEKGFEAIKAYGAGCAYMSGYIFNSKIMKKVLNDTSGKKLNRRFGYAFCFINLAIEMLEFGKLSYRKEILTDQFVNAKRDTTALFDCGKIAYSPEKTLESIEEKIDALARTSLNEEQKFYMCEHCLNRQIVECHISEYKSTYNNVILEDIRKSGEKEIYNYYIENRKKLEKEDIFKEIENSINTCIGYIDDIHMFNMKYEKLMRKYNQITKEFLNKKYEILNQFKKELKLG